MASYFGRRVLRAKNLPPDIAKKLGAEICEFLPLEKVSVSQDEVCVYVPHQLKNSVKQKMISVLNNTADAPSVRKHNDEDIEMCSTIVLVTNIPHELTESHVDKLMCGFGKTLTKFQLLSIDHIAYSKYGWIVFEDIGSAEKCVDTLQSININSTFLSCCLLPDDINTVLMLKKVFTVQLEGFPASLCFEEKIREILNAVCPRIWKLAKYIQTKVISSNATTKKERYIALIDWPTVDHAVTCFQKLDSFTVKRGQSIMVLKACFVLPGVSAIKDFCSSIEIQTCVTSASSRCETITTPPQTTTVSSPQFPRSSPPSYRESVNQIPLQNSSLLSTPPKESETRSVHRQRQRIPPLPLPTPYLPPSLMSSSRRGIHPPLVAVPFMHHGIMQINNALALSQLSINSRPQTNRQQTTSSNNSYYNNSNYNNKNNSNYNYNNSSSNSNSSSNYNNKNNSNYNYNNSSSNSSSNYNNNNNNNNYNNSSSNKRYNSNNIRLSNRNSTNTTNTINNSNNSNSSNNSSYGNNNNCNGRNKPINSTINKSNTENIKSSPQYKKEGIRNSCEFQANDTKQPATSTSDHITNTSVPVIKENEKDISVSAGLDVSENKQRLQKKNVKRWSVSKKSSSLECNIDVEEENKGLEENTAVQSTEENTAVQSTEAQREPIQDINTVDKHRKDDICDERDKKPKYETSNVTLNSEAHVQNEDAFHLQKKNLRDAFVIKEEKSRFLPLTSSPKCGIQEQAGCERHKSSATNEMFLKLF